MTNIKHADKVIGKKVKYLKKDKGVIHKIARDMRSRLISRVGKGKDNKGSTFTKYSPSTLEQKQGLGRSGQVDLSDTNTMLKSVGISSHQNYADVYLGARKNIGMYHQKGMGTLPTRAWFGYTKKSEKQARKDYEKHINKSLRK